MYFTWQCLILLLQNENTCSSIAFPMLCMMRVGGVCPVWLCTAHGRDKTMRYSQWMAVSCIALYITDCCVETVRLCSTRWCVGTPANSVVLGVPVPSAMLACVCTPITSGICVCVCCVCVHACMRERER
jgi:hypothetical protein